MADSYLSLKNVVQDQITRVSIKREQYVDIIKTTDTYFNEEHKAIRNQITKDFRELDKDLKALAAGVELIEKNRTKFVQVKDAELVARRKTYSDMKIAVEEIKASLNTVELRKKIENDEHKAKRKSEGLGVDINSNIGNPQAESENASFIEDQRKQVKAQLLQQDEILDNIDSGLDRLQETGRAINAELKVQDKMLDKLGDDLDHAGQKMGVVMKALSKTLQTKDTCQIGMVLAMGLILLCLIALIIWT